MEDWPFFGPGSFLVCDVHCGICTSNILGAAFWVLAVMFPPVISGSSPSTEIDWTVSYETFFPFQTSNLGHVCCELQSYRDQANLAVNMP
jgi:hypothetical protein